MKFKVIFVYDNEEAKWDVFIEGATSALEALQGFNAVLITAHDAIPRVECNKATLEPDGTYKISVGVTV